MLGVPESTSNMKKLIEFGGALKRQRQVDWYEFKDTLVYIVKS